MNNNPNMITKANNAVIIIDIYVAQFVQGADTCYVLNASVIMEIPGLTRAE